MRQPPVSGSEAYHLGTEVVEVDYPHGVVALQVPGAFAGVEDGLTPLPVQAIKVGVAVQGQLMLRAQKAVELQRVVHHGDAPAMPVQLKRRVGKLKAVGGNGPIQALAL